MKTLRLHYITTYTANVNQCTRAPLGCTTFLAGSYIPFYMLCREVGDLHTRHRRKKRQEKKASVLQRVLCACLEVCKKKKKFKRSLTNF